MKYFKILWTLPCSLLLFTSCKKQIDEAFTNPNANVIQPIEAIMPNIIQNMAISNTAQGSLYGPQNDGQYIGRFIQNWATNTSNNQFDQMSQATTKTTAATSDILGGVWASHYYGMGANLNRVIEWGTEQKKWDYVGVAYAIKAWSWLSLTDIHGEVILKEAFDPSRRVFDYDPQQDVYEEVKRDVRLAVDYLNRTGDGVDANNLATGAQWFSLKGDREKWKKFAYSVMARCFNRYTNKKNLYQPDSVIYYANLGINDNNDNAYVLFSGVNTAQMSYYGPTRANLNALRQTKFVADLESGLDSTFLGVSDPRAWYIIKENTNGTFKGVIPVKGTTGLVTNDIPPTLYGRYVFQDAMPWPVITATEMQFLKAEAYYRKGQKPQALDAYKNGISTDIDMLTSTYSTNVPAAHLITPAMKTTFLSDPVLVPTADNLTLSHIMLQKYIALYGYGFIETWVDMRRFHYVDHENNNITQVYANFIPPAFADLYVDNKGKYIYRSRPRYNSEVYNQDALSVIGALALDYHTKEMWFSIYE